MLDANREIILAENEAIEILKDINLIIVSLHDMGSYYKNKDISEYQQYI
jgi:hypothetical protein